MSIVVVGLNHKTAPISLLERLAVSADLLPKALHQVSTYDHVVESLVLSTCNRVEIYGNVTKFHGGAQDLRNFLSEFCHVAPEDFSDHLYTYHDEGALGHLFRVAAGIDSMVLGESEILGQVRRALQAAEEEGTVARTLRRAFTRALSVGKRARTETEIGRNPVSISSAAVELARRAWPETSLATKRVLIVGAGKMGRLAVRALSDAGARDVTVVNRGEERAQAISDEFRVEPLPLGELGSALMRADIVICSTTAPQILLEKQHVEAALSARDRRPLFIVDIAVPRDVDPSVATLPGVVLRDIDDLRWLVDANLGARLQEVSKVEEVIAAETERFARWEKELELAPTLASLVERAEAIRESELARARIEEWPPERRAAIEQLTKRIVNKLLHAPLEKSKELASSKVGHLYIEALYELFELDDDSPS